MGLRVIPRQTESTQQLFFRKEPSTNNKSVLSLQEVDIEKEFDIVKTLSEGCFSKVLLAKQNGDRLVLKAVHCEATSAEDFSRELKYNYFLSPHPNIVTSYTVAFMWDNCFIYVQEFAPYGDLSRFIKKGGLPEAQVKTVATQLCSAVEFIHSFQLVHRDLRPENILVFRKDLSLVKLCDFGCTRPQGTQIMKTPHNQSWASFSPPEIAEILLKEKYLQHSSADVWQVGMILISCLTGGTPWGCADITDPVYCQYIEWLKRKSLRIPEQFQLFSTRFLRLLKRILEPKPSKRYKIQEISKYLNDDWVLKGAVVSALRRTSVERHESNATSKSGHRQRYTKKRSTRSLALDNEIESEAQTVAERVGRWIDTSVLQVHA